MKKNLIVIGALLFGVVELLANIDGFWDLLVRLGIDQNKITVFMHVLKAIVEIILPLAVGYLLWKYFDFKEKLIVLKSFRDKEMISVTDHYNAQIHAIEIRLDILNDSIKKAGQPGFTYSAEIDPNDQLNQELRNKQRKIEIEAYNKSFKDWKMDDYGKNHNQTFYKKDEFPV